MRARASALYAGRVRHTRLRPRHHDFEYRVFYGLFDIDELDDLDRDMTLFSVDRFNLYSFDPGDYGPADGSPLRGWVEEVVARAGIDLQGGTVLLMAMPRMLGYVFNPLTVWYCYGPEGNLEAVLHEVRNTFGDRHTYVVPIRPGGLQHSFEKMLHVSPFNDMEQTYQFTVSEPGERLSIGIEQNDASGSMFRAGLRLSRLPFTDANLVKLFLSHPLLTVKVIGGIHWQALRLWIKGGDFHKRPDPPANNITVVGVGSMAA